MGQAWKNHEKMVSGFGENVLETCFLFVQSNDARLIYIVQLFTWGPGYQNHILSQQDWKGRGLPKTMNPSGILQTSIKSAYYVGIYAMCQHEITKDRGIWRKIVLVASTPALHYFISLELVRPKHSASPEVRLHNFITAFQPLSHLV